MKKETIHKWYSRVQSIDNVTKMKSNQLSLTIAATSALRYGIWRKYLNVDIKHRLHVNIDYMVSVKLYGLLLIHLMRSN